MLLAGTGTSTHACTSQNGASCKHCTWVYHPSVDRPSWIPTLSCGRCFPYASYLSVVNHHRRVSFSRHLYFSVISASLRPA
ncbi:hypothetical protein Hanom_Chr01g00013131 [Helianthus anomalus]